MTHDRPQTMPGEWHKFLTGQLKKSELDVTIRVSISGVGVLYLRFGTLYENKV